MYSKNSSGLKRLLNLSEPSYPMTNLNKWININCSIQLLHLTQLV